MFYESLVYFSFLFLYVTARTPKPYNQTVPSSIYENPNFIRDRFRDEIWKPPMNASWINRFRKPFHPAWMDYCDPYHCNDYHKVACGLNRKTMKFRWFQSVCHIILNNQCSTYRGNLKYDSISPKYCTMYVMFLRAGCGGECQEGLEPLCAISMYDYHVVIFKNRCAFDAANCRTESFQEYEEVSMAICARLL